MVLRGCSIEDIEEVRSHQMPILQCKDFLNQYSKWKIINDLDTALIVVEINKKGIKNCAAIASRKAAEVYGPDILCYDIQIFKDNSTRFFDLKKEKEELKDFNKASIRFLVAHRVGGLINILKEIADCDINLDKAQSVPTIDKPW